jgi:DNA-binding NtrC family response regulator
MQVTPRATRGVSRKIAVPEKTEIGILVVEDDIDDFRAISRLLSELRGYSVKTTRASTGLAARSCIYTRCFDVIIADYRLGPETGVDVIKSISRQRPDIAAVLVTRYVSSDVFDAALNAGAIQCIDKDELDVPTLESVIQTAVLPTPDDPEEETEGQDSPGWLN